MTTKGSVFEMRIHQRAKNHHMNSNDHKGEFSLTSSRNSSPSFGFAMARYKIGPYRSEPYSLPQPS
jgi:hypothetical protein